ncbi:MAG: hypothetical protein K6T29_00370 [Peptococcaceae bacterium]|nr:hypothetical protein [Peptococcaceae bacterium]
MDTNIHHRTISSEYLGITEEIKGTYPAEVRAKARATLARWAALEKRRRERDGIHSLEHLAQYDTRRAGEFLEECRSILQNNLNAAKLDWAALYDDRPYPPFVFQEPPPRYETIAREMGVPERRFLAELFFPSMKKRRLHLENEARLVLAARLRQHRQREEAARAAHEAQRSACIREQSEYNSSVEQLQLDFERGLPAAVESAARIALARLQYPDAFQLEFDAQYHQAEMLLAADCIFPAPVEMPRAVRYVYNEEEHGLAAVAMPQKDFDELYKSVLLQTTLAAIHTLFESVRHVRRVGFNGLVRDGESTVCILTCVASRDRFGSLDLTRTPPEECFPALAGVMAEPLTELTPVQPLVRINRAEPLYSETAPISDGGPPPRPEAYRPGDFGQEARELISDMLGQIEKDLLEPGRPFQGPVH